MGGRAASVCVGTRHGLWDCLRREGLAYVTQINNSLHRAITQFAGFRWFERVSKYRRKIHFSYKDVVKTVEMTEAFSSVLETGKRPSTVNTYSVNDCGQLVDGKVVRA